jgi:hypothetical protein
LAVIDLAFMRDQIVVNAQFESNLHQLLGNRGVAAGSCILLAARSIVHEPAYMLHVQGYRLIVVADSYEGAGGSIDVGGSAGAAGSPGAQGARGFNPGGDGGPGSDGTNGGPGGDATALTVICQSLRSSRFTANGGAGGAGGVGGAGGGGGPGRPGHPGKFDPIDPGEGGHGGDGGNGGNGGKGGQVRVMYVDGAPPVLEASGGAAGAGGAPGSGGPNGAWAHPTYANPGAPGRDGAAGRDGQATIEQVDVAGFWGHVQTELAAYAGAWAEYRLRMGDYYFRAYHAAGANAAYRGLAYDEFTAVRALNPSLHQAQVNLDHLIGNRNILGQARDLDVFPDFDRYDSFVLTGAQLVEGILDFANGDFLANSLRETTTQTLGREIAHLQGMKPQLEAESRATLDGQKAAQQEKGDADQRVKDVAAQIQAAIEAEKNKSIDIFGTVIGTVGLVASVIGAIPTGGTSLLAVIPAVASVFADIKTTGVLGEIEGALHLGSDEQQKAFQKLEKDAGSVKEIVQKNLQAVKSLISFPKMLTDLWSAQVEGGSAQIQQLMAKSVELAHAQLLAGLRSDQADAQYQVVLAKIQQRDQDEQAASDELRRIQAGTRNLDAAAQAIIQASHTYFDTLGRYAFYAARSLELYTLADLSAEIRYDYGYVHPDIEQDYFEGLRSREEYIGAYQATWQGIPTLTVYRQQYLDYFTRASGDLVRDVLKLSFNDPALIAELQSTRVLSLPIDLSAMPPNYVEAKAEVVYLALVGADEEIIPCVVEHAGISRQMRRDGSVVTQYLRPRTTVVQARNRALTASDLISPITDPLNAPRVIGFWGRGVATTWRLTIDGPVDLSKLSQIECFVGYVAFRTKTPPISIALDSPAAETAVGSSVLLGARASGIPQIVFTARYATDPTDASTVATRPIGRGTEETSGHWTFLWDTTNVPDQGNSDWGTVTVCATALDDSGNLLGEPVCRRVDVRNGANLLLNPSFEGESGDWQPMNQADAVTLQWMSDPAQAKDGSGFLRISTAQRDGSLAQDVILPWSNGRSYTCQAWVRAAPGGAATVDGALALWALGGQSAEVNSAEFTAGPDWTLVQVTLPVQQSGHQTLRAELYLHSTDMELDVDATALS